MANGSGEFDPGAGRLLGTNDLQSTIDKFNTAVNTLSSTVSNMSSTAANGMTRSPAASAGAAGATFSAGAFPSMGSWANQATILGQPGGSSGGGTLNQMAAGGNGASGAGASQYNWKTGWQVGPQTQQGTFGSIGPQPYSGGPGGPGTPGGPPLPPFVNSGQMMGGAAASIGSGVVNAMNSTPAQFVMSTGMSQLNNQLLFNSYGQQMTAQWGGSAQTAQNQAFGNGANGVVNNSAMGNASSAAQEFGTLTQMAGGANVTGTAAFGATNALAFANQGLGAAGASQVASQIYNPTSSMQMQMLTGVSAINQSTGKQNSLSSIIGGLAGQGYLGGGSYNSKTGTFGKSALNASFTANRGTSYMNLQSLGYSQSQIQDIQSTLSQANNAALKGHTTTQNVLNTENQAQYGSEGGTNNANSQLAKWGISLSTVQKQGNQSSLNLSQSQSQSSTYNQSVSDFTSAMTKATNALNWFLDKTGLGKGIGAVQGAGAGYSSSGMQGWVSGISNTVKAVMGGGAGNVSATSSMTSQGTSAGSSMSSVSGSARTAVRDAEQQVGKPYVYGGDSPGAGFDCSGLVQWSYGAAGVHLPRTSQQQWASLRNRSVPLNQVREGDIIFSAGSDGTASAPGHEALMISNNQIVEAPHSGADIRIRGFNPGEWQHAARPTGSVGRSGGAAGVSGTQTGFTGSRLSAGNAGGGGSGDSALGLVTDADAMLFGGGTNGAGMSAGGLGSGGNGGSSTSSTSGAGMQTGATGGAMSAAQISRLWTSLGGPASAAGNMARIANAESGDHPGIRQQGVAAGVTGYGLYQITPTSGIRQDGQFGNLLNASNNTKAAISLYKKSGYSPWSSDPVGAGLTGMADGGPIVVGERGPELFMPKQSGSILTAGQTSNLLRGNAAQSAQAPWSATPAQSLLLDMLSPANSRARQGGGGGITVQVAPGAVNITGSGGGSTTSDIQTAGQTLVREVEKALAKSDLIQNVANGVT